VANSVELLEEICFSSLN